MREEALEQRSLAEVTARHPEQATALGYALGDDPEAGLADHDVGGGDQVGVADPCAGDAQQVRGRLLRLLLDHANAAGRGAVDAAQVQLGDAEAAEREEHQPLVGGDTDPLTEELGGSSHRLER